MKRFLAVILLTLLAGLSSARAQSADDQYVRLYDGILAADALNDRGASSEALAKYIECLTSLQRFQKSFPSWNGDVLKFRLEYLAAKVSELSTKAPAAPPPSTTTEQAPGAAQKTAPADWEGQINALKAEVQQLQAAKGLLEAKLKEALAAQPAAVDPREVTKAEERIRILQKENELLTVSLNQQKVRAVPAVGGKAAKGETAELARQLEEQRALVSRLNLEKEALQARLKAAPTAPTPAPAASSPAPAGGTSELAELRARLEALEAQAVPYTPEEMAFLKQTDPRISAVAPVRKLSTRRSRANAALLAEGQRAAAAREYDKAQEKFLKALEEDPENVPLLANLAEVEIQTGRLDAAEKHITKAIQLAPDDALNYSTLGTLKVRQGNVDEAIDALSRAAKLDPQNADTQNRLGIALGQKGLRGPAEAALRKAVQLQPGYADAHKNLAVMYLSQEPPLGELARWHYQKAMAAGAPVNPELEKMFAAKNVPVGKK
jgi:tetratricopeptide (TPR) repeat protein